MLLILRKRKCWIGLISTKVPDLRALQHHQQTLSRRNSGQALGIEVGLPLRLQLVIGAIAILAAQPHMVGVLLQSIGIRMFSDRNQELETGVGKVNVNCRCNSVLRWVTRKNLPRGKVTRLELPENFSNRLASSQVDALRTENDLYCVLLKSSIGWKENFTGTLCCNRPLNPDQVIKDTPDRIYISITGFFPFEELYLSKDHGNGKYHVYFDLN